MHPLLKNYFALIKKFIPESTPGTSLGIDIGSTDCKFIQIIPEEQNFKLLKWGTEPIVNNDAKTALQKIIEKLEVPPRRLYTSVSGKGTLVRYIDMPRMSADELRNAFELESDKYFPFPQDQVYTDCYITDPQEKGKSMKIIAAAAKKDLVDERVKLIQACGLNVDFIGINSVALTNSASVLGQWDECPKDAATVAIMDIGDSVSNLTIMINKVPLFSRDIFVGAREFTKNISRSLNIPLNEAEILKADPKDKLDEIHMAIEPAVLNIVKDMRLSFDYFATEHNKEIQGLMFTGGGALLAGLSENVSEILEINVWPWNPLKSLKLSEDISADMIEKNGMKFGVALGLALYDYD